MTFFTSITPPVLFASGLTLGIIVLLALEIYNSRRVNKLTYPVYEYALKRAEEEANRIVAEARKAARDLLDTAEAESLRLASTHKSQDDAVEKSYQDGLKTMLAGLETKLEVSASAAVEAQKSISAELSASLQKQGEDARVRMEQSLDAFAREQGKRIDGQLTQLFNEAKQEAEAYATARKGIIDTRIYELVGDTMKIVLGKNLPPEVHADLVVRALEEAKANHVF